MRTKEKTSITPSLYPIHPQYFFCWNSLGKVLLQLIQVKSIWISWEAIYEHRKKHNFIWCWTIFKRRGERKLNGWKASISLCKFTLKNLLESDADEPHCISLIDLVLMNFLYIPRIRPRNMIASHFFFCTFNFMGRDQFDGREFVLLTVFIQQFY